MRAISGRGRGWQRPLLGLPLEAERESARAALTKAGEELERVEWVKAESTAGTLQAELTELRAESRKTLENVTAWVERVTGY